MDLIIEKIMEAFMDARPPLDGLQITRWSAEPIRSFGLDLNDHICSLDDLASTVGILQRAQHVECHAGSYRSSKVKVGA